MNKFKINNKEIALKIAQPKDRHYGKVHSTKSSYPEKERVRGAKFNNNISYLQSNVLSNIISAPPAIPNTSQTTNSSYLKNNYSISGYNITESGTSTQIPYGAPPPFLTIQVFNF